MKKWFIDDVFIHHGRVYDRGYYIREDGFIEWTEPIPNGRTHEFPVGECFHPAGPLSLEAGDPIMVEDGELLGAYAIFEVDGIVIEDARNVIKIQGNWIGWYDEETDTLYDTAPIQIINGNILEINDEYLSIEKEDGFELRILDGLGNVQEVIK